MSGVTRSTVCRTLMLWEHAVWFMLSYRGPSLGCISPRARTDLSGLGWNSTREPSSMSDCWMDFRSIFILTIADPKPSASRIPVATACSAWNPHHQTTLFPNIFWYGMELKFYCTTTIGHEIWKVPRATCWITSARRKYWCLLLRTVEWRTHKK
jgi:hypothetical protein